MSYDENTHSSNITTTGMNKTASSAVVSNMPRTDHAGPGPQLMGADTLIGNAVVNTSADSLGDIKEIMLDMSTGHVRYAVLAYGGFLGLGEKLFAVPWAALTLDTTNKRFVLDTSKERLESAPGFDKDAWPSMADTLWQQHGNDPHGVTPQHGL